MKVSFSSLKWGLVLAAVGFGAYTYRATASETLAPEELLPADAARTAHAEAAQLEADKEGLDPVAEAVAAGRQLYETWRYDEARESLELALELDPDSIEAWYNLGLVEFRQPGDFARSVAAFEKAMELDPTDGRFPLGLAGAIGAQVISKGSLLAGAARVPRVKELLRASVELDPDSIDSRKGLFQFYLRVPGLLGGGVANAEEQAAALEALDPVEGFIARAQIDSDAERFEDAEAKYRAAVGEDPERGSSHRSLGEFLMRHERAVEALASFEEGARLDPNDPASFEGLGRAQFALEQKEEAEASYRRALELNPDSLMAAMRLGAALAERNEDAEAREVYRGIVDRLGESPWVEDAREWLEDNPE